jgi:peptidoglycan-associated lipoprotein
MTRTLLLSVVVCAGLAAGCAKDAQKTSETTAAKTTQVAASKSDAHAAADSKRNTDDLRDAVVCDEVKVHFAFNSAEIQPQDKAKLEKTAACLKGNRNVKLTIEGNADERGTEEYNLALGEQRAQSVARYLELLGGSRDAMKTVSYGETNPVCTTSQDEACWSQNRRAAVKPSK